MTYNLKTQDLFLARSWRDTFVSLDGKHLKIFKPKSDMMVAVVGILGVIVMVDTENPDLLGGCPSIIQV